MKIRNKILLIFLVYLLICMLSIYIYLKRTVVEGYKHYEKQLTTQQVNSVWKEYQEMIYHLKKFAYDWANWDDSYQFIQDANNEYINCNLGKQTFIDSQINYMFFYNSDGQFIHGRTFDLTKNEFTSNSEKLVKKLFQYANQSGFVIYQKDDILSPNDKVILMTSVPIRDSDKTKPSVGFLVVGYDISKSMMHKLGNKFNLSITSMSISPMSRAQFKTDIEFINLKQILATVWLPTIDNHTVYVQYSTNRDISSLIQRSAFQLTFALISFLILLSLIFIFSLHKIVVLRIEEMSSIVFTLTKEQTFNRRLSITGKDEISTLKKAINEMLYKIISSTKKYELLYEETPCLHMVLSPNGEILDINKSFLKHLGYSSKKLLGKDIETIIFKDDVSLFNEIRLNMLAGKIHDQELQFTNSKGNACILLLSSAYLTNQENIQKDIILVSGINITERKKMEETLLKYARYDLMTEVYNRRYGFQQLETAMFHAKKHKEPLTVCFIDINNLKIVNDSFGHAYGDQLIKDTVHLIKNCVRSYDVIIRLGGDEFLVFFPNSTLQESEKIFERIEHQVEHFNALGRRTFKISLSRGFAEYDGQIHVDELVEIADKRMYENKIIKKQYEKL